MNPSYRQLPRAGTLAVVVAAVLVHASSLLFAQEPDRVKSELFREIDAAIQKARQEEVPTYAPNLFSKVLEFYSRADADYKKGERLEGIREKLREALKTLRGASEAAKVSKLALERVQKVRNEIGRKEYIKLASDEFADAERNYLEALAKAEAGDLRAARKSVDEAMQGYREVTILILEKGPVKDAEDFLERSRKMLSRAAYDKATRDLDGLKTEVDNARDREFEPAALMADIRAKIGDIVSVLYPPFYRYPPDTLTMGGFTLIVESYDSARGWDFDRNVITNASGIAWTSFACDVTTLLPLLPVDMKLTPKTFSVVQIVRNPLTELSLQEAKLFNPGAKVGEEVQLDLPARTTAATDILKARKDLLDLFGKKKGNIKVRFEKLTIEPTASPKVGKVLEGLARYPTVPPVPKRITLSVAGFTVYLDSLLIAPKTTHANAELEFPSSILDMTECRPAHVPLGRITITPSCQFHTELAGYAFGPWILDNSGVVIAGNGVVADFSTTWKWPGWTTLPLQPSAWRGVVLNHGSTVPHTTVDTSNVGFLYGKYDFTNATVIASGIDAKLNLDGGWKFVTLTPLSYSLSLHSGSLHMQGGWIKEGSFVADGLLPLGVTTQSGDPIPVRFAAFTVDSLLNITGDVDTIKHRMKLSDGYSLAVISGKFFLPSAPVGLPPLYFDAATYNRHSISTLLDTNRLPGLTATNRQIEALTITSKDANIPLTVKRPRGWLNVVTQGGIGDIYFFASEKETLTIACRLGQPGMAGYKSDSTFGTTFKDTVVFDFVHNATYHSYLKGNIRIPYPCGPVGVGVRIPFHGMQFTSLASSVGGNPSFADTITLDYWGVGITSRWGVVSVRTGEILYTDAEIIEARHFARGFKIYWGEMLADGNLGNFFFNYNSGNQKFDGFPFTVHTASLSRYTGTPTFLGADLLLGYLEATGDVHFPFWGSRTITIRDYKYPSHGASPYNARYVRINPSSFAVQRNWGSGRADMNFTTVFYDSLDQDGFNGRGQVTLMGPLDGTIASTIDLSSIVTNICYCSDGFEAGAGGSFTPVQLTGAMGDIRLGPIGGCIQIIGDQLERIYIEGPIEISGAAGWAGFGASLQIDGAMVVEITPTTVTLGTFAGMAIGLTDVIGLRGMASVKFTAGIDGLKGDISGAFDSSPVQVGGAGQFSTFVGFPPAPSFYFQGAVKTWVYFFGTGMQAEGAFLASLNAPRNELWALDKIGKNLTANDVLDGFGIGPNDRLTGFYGGGKFGGSVSLIGIISGGFWVWGGAGQFFVTSPPGVVAMGNAGVQISGEVLWGLLSASLWAEMGGALGTGFSLCGSAGIDCCCCWELICFGWSGSVCIGTGGISTQ